MLIVNRIPQVSPLNQVTNEIDRLFETMWSDAVRPAATGPAMNVWETEAAYFIESELPGMSMKDIDVSVLENRVTIKGTRTLAEPEGGKFLRRERRGGTFTRTWTFPAPINADNVQATLKDGVLQVTLPKSPAALPRRIEVKSNRD